MTRAARAGIVGLAGLMASACVVGPKYAPPKPPAPASDSFAASTAAITSAEPLPDRWWRLYNDPAIDALVQEALVHNTDLLTAAGNLAQARGALALAQAGRFPSTTLSGGAQYGVSSDQLLLGELKKGAPPSPGWVYTAGLDVSYEVDLFGRVRRTIEAARADVQAQQAAEDVVRVSVAGETTRAYVDACAYAKELQVAQQALDMASQTYDVTVKEARDGAASDFDVARAREAVEQVRATLPTYAVQRQVALFQLAVLTGRPPEEISAAAGACVDTPKLPTVLPVGDVQGLFRRRPDVRQAERQLAAAVARVGVATADLYPTITLGASVASAATTPAGLVSRSNLAYGIGPLLSWSFPNTLVAQAEIQQARGVASAAYASFQGAVLTALQDTESALVTYGQELNRNAALATAAAQSATAFKLAQDRFRLGSISYLDLLTAQNDLIQTNASLAASNQNLASDQVTVFKALGGGWEQAPPVTPLPIVDGRTGRAVQVR